MAIEKMRLVNIVGNLPDLDETLLSCIRSEVFSPEMAINTLDKSSGFAALTGENEYAGALKPVSYTHLKKIIGLSPLQYRKEHNL